MVGPGQKYVRMIYSKDGIFDLWESKRGVPEEVLNVVFDIERGWYIIVGGTGSEVPKSAR